MEFKYDDQTFQDLEILSDNRESVFSIFNHTLTDGASDFLKILIQNPVIELEELEKRIEIIEYFSKNKVTLAISSRQFKFIEKYLSLSISVLKITQ